MINYVTKFRVVLVRHPWDCRLEYDCTILSEFLVGGLSFAAIKNEYPGWRIEGVARLSEEPITSIDVANDLNFTFTVNPS